MALGSLPRTPRSSESSRRPCSGLEGWRLLLRLAARGVRTLDLLPTLLETEGQVYWEKDYHLAPKGQAAIASAFLAVFADLLPRR